MTDPAGALGRPARRPRGQWVLYWFDLALLVAGGGYAALLVAFISVFGSVDLGWLVYLPVGGWVAAVVLAVVGGITAYRDRRSPLPAVGRAALVLLVGLVAGFALGQLLDSGHGA